MTKPQTLETPHGDCVLVELADDDAYAEALARLTTAERAHAERLSEARRRGFVGGRYALHLALDDFRVAILSDDRGAPILPPGWSGSISHKGALAAAIVAQAGAGYVGLDLEVAAPPKVDIAPRILTPREQAALPDRGRAVTLRFAIKEAIYKAVDPVVRRYVGFTEVELELVVDRCRVSSALPLAIDAAFREHGGHWIATARATRR